MQPLDKEVGRGGWSAPASPTSHPSASLLSSFPHTSVLLLVEKSEPSAWILANVGGPETRMAVLVTEVLSPTEGLPLGDSHWLPRVLWTRAWRMGHSAWKLHSGELIIMVLGASRKGAQRETAHVSFQLVRTREAEVMRGSTVFSPQEVRHQERPHVSEGLSPLARHKGMKERKQNRKARGFCNRCSAGTACCKHGWMLDSCFLSNCENHQRTGMESKAKHSCPHKEPPGGLAPCLQALSPRCLVQDSD